MNKISKILTVVTMIAAMAVPTFGGDMNGTHTIGLGYSGLVNPTDTTYD